MKFNFTFMQGAQMFTAIIVLTLVAVGLLIANPDVIESLLPEDRDATVSNPVITPINVNTQPNATVFSHQLTKEQFVHAHHQLVCDRAGINCDFGIYREDIDSFEMGMARTVIAYSENMSVFPHIGEGALEVNQSYVIATISTYTVYVNGEVLNGMFEGVFNGRDTNGYHFTVISSTATSPVLAPGTIVTVPYVHGGFLTPNSH